MREKRDWNSNGIPDALPRMNRGGRRGKRADGPPLPAPKCHRPAPNVRARAKGGRSSGYVIFRRNATNWLALPSISRESDSRELVVKNRVIRPFLFAQDGNFPSVRAANVTIRAVTLTSRAFAREEHEATNVSGETRARACLNR